jgi:hypothetical protein
MPSGGQLIIRVFRKDSEIFSKRNVQQRGDSWVKRFLGKINSFSVIVRIWRNWKIVAFISWSLLLHISTLLLIIRTFFLN